MSIKGLGKKQRRVMEHLYRGGQIQRYNYNNGITEYFIEGIGDATPQVEAMLAKGLVLKGTGDGMFGTSVNFTYDYEATFKATHAKK